MTSVESQNPSPAAAAARATWALGDYPAAAAEIIPNLGADLVVACGEMAGRRVLDVAAGSGNAAIPAAVAGAAVVAADITPEMFPAGRAEAERRGVELEWVTADAAGLPFEAGEFDVVMSCVGAMFVPDHQACAEEMLRVLRPGGTLGLISWTAEGFVGQMFGVLKPFAPAPPPGAQSPLLWGDDSHVASLLGDRVTDLHMRRTAVRVTAFSASAEFRDCFKTKYGPVFATYQRLADDPERVIALDEALDELAARTFEQGGSTEMDWEYLLVTARRRDEG